MEIKDVVFEQHYKKRMDANLQEAANQGVMHGISIVMKCLQDFEDKKIAITAQGMVDYLETLGIKKS